MLRTTLLTYLLISSGIQLPVVIADNRFDLVDGLLTVYNKQLMNVPQNTITVITDSFG